MGRWHADAIQRSANAGALFVASAGNDGTDNDTYASYPASFTVSNMITVAATTSRDEFLVLEPRPAQCSPRGTRSSPIIRPRAGPGCSSITCPIG